MIRGALALSLVVTGTLLVACGPKRQAAWEQESAQKQTTQPADPAAAEVSTQELMSKAEAAWQERSDQAKVEEAIAAWEEVVAQNPTHAGALNNLARAYYFLADAHLRPAGDDEAMLATYEKGILAGENAMMAISPDFKEQVTSGAKVEEAVKAIPKEGQEALYWYASSLGKFAVAKGFTTQLFYKDRIFAVMEHVLNLDETFFYGAPHRYFGAFYAKAPAFAGGDMAKAKEHFDKSLAIDERYLGTKVLYAEYYATKADDKEMFTTLLNDVISADPAIIPEVQPENVVEQEKAKALLAAADDMF